MAEKAMKIHAFHVRQVNKADQFGLSDVLVYCNSIDLPQRIAKLVRLEKLSIEAAAHFFDITKQRATVLPGKATVSTPTKPLGLQSDENISEETAGMYVEGKDGHGILILQYNHFGPHKGTIEEYFNYFAEDAFRKKFSVAPDKLAQFEISHILDENVQKKFESMKIVKSVEITMANPLIGDSGARLGRSVEQVIDWNLVRGAHKAKLKFQAGRDKEDSLALKRVKKIWSWLKDENSVEKFQVKGRTDEDGDTELVDLLEMSLSGYKNIAINDDDRRLSVEVRWAALKEQYSKWRISKEV